MTDDGALIPAKARLKDAISALIDPRPYTIKLDGGNHRRTFLDSRYDQLRDAVAGGRYCGGARQLAAELIPLWADGFDLVAEIDTIAAGQAPGCTHWHELTETGTTVARLGVIDARTWRPQDCEQINRITGDLESWAKHIDRLFSAKPKHLPDPCPYCDAKMVLRGSGDHQVRVPALQITLDGCECQGCHHRWIGFDQLAILGQQLGYRGVA